MALFNKNNSTQFQISERQLLEAKYTNARHDILFLIIFTVINCALLLLNANTYFLFSAFIPYSLVDDGMFWTGKYPAEYYEGLDGLEFENDSYLIVMCVLAVICIGLYLLCWFMSKKKAGWMVASLVFIVIDTLALILFVGVAVDWLLDYLFHAFIIYCIVRGIVAHHKLKNLPPEDAVVEVVDFEEAPVAQAEATLVVEEAPVTEEVVVEETAAEESTPAENNETQN